jgi:hypothetical protein
MTEIEKASEIVESHMTFIDDPVTYQGDRMEYSRLLEKSKACARYTAKEVLCKLKGWKAQKHAVDFWEQVLIEIDNL